MRVKLDALRGHPMIRRLTSYVRREPSYPAVADWDLHPLIHPMEVSGGRGGCLFDKDGNRFVDLVSAWGANILGYGHPVIADAIARQAREGVGFGLPSGVGRRLERLLCDLIPCAEAVKFGKNGSDATLAAVRLARAVTGRNLILYRGYHGFDDWYMAPLNCPGTPPCLRDQAMPVHELTPNSVRHHFEKHANQVAALIVDTAIPPLAPAETWEEIRSVVKHHGALLIFDEIGTGFRLHAGGVQAMTGVHPDLACFGKAMANGMPISALVGPQRLMDKVDGLSLGMTFQWEALSMASAEACIGEILRTKVCERLWEKGRVLQTVCNRIAADAGVPVSLHGSEPRLQLATEDAHGIPAREMRWLMVQELVRNRVMTLGTFLLSDGHDEGNLEEIIAAWTASVKVAEKALRRGSVDGLLNEQLLGGLRNHD